MNIDYKKELFKSGRKTLHFSAARKIIRHNYPDLVSDHKIGSSTKNGKISPVVDWKTIFAMQPIQLLLLGYMNDKVEHGVCTGYDCFEHIHIRFLLKGDFALRMSYPPHKTLLKNVAKIKMENSNLTEEEFLFITRYYGL